MRARNIKPDFFLNEELSEIDFGTRLLFIGLWCYADCEGRFELKYKKIKAAIFPYDNFDVKDGICKLMSLHLITCNNIVGQVVNFKKHQRTHPHEAKSVLPPVEENIVKNQCHDIGTPCHTNVTRCKPDIMNDDIMNDDIMNDDVMNVTEPEKKSDSVSPHSAENQLEVFDCQRQEANNSISPTQDVPQQPPIIAIPLVCKKTGPQAEFWVTQEMLSDWAESYPAVDVIQELREIRQWNISNPTRRKTKAGIMDHITTWLAKEQNKGGSARQRALPGKDDRFKTIVSTGDRKLDISMTNAANFVKRRMEGIQLAD